MVGRHRHAKAISSLHTPSFLVSAQFLGYPLPLSQVGSALFYKATPLNLSQTVLLTGDQAFKDVNL